MNTFLGREIPEGFTTVRGMPPDPTVYRGDPQARQEAQNAYMQHLAEFGGIPEREGALDTALSFLEAGLALGRIVPFISQHDPARVAEFQGVPHRPTDGGVGPRMLLLAFPDVELLTAPDPNKPDYAEKRPFVYDDGLHALKNKGGGAFAQIQIALIQRGFPIPNPSPLIPASVLTENDALLAKAALETAAALQVEI